MHAQTPDATSSMEKDRLIKAILKLEMPFQLELESLAENIRAVLPKAAQEPVPQTAAIRARRAELQTLPEDDLRQLLARTTAEKSRQEEARRFYNQPNAIANFAYWLGMDFWSLDEAVALLTARDPRIVNRATIEADIAPKRGKPPGAGNQPTTFTKLFLNLSHLAERSNAMTHSPRLTPVEVIRWAKGVMGAKVPAPLLAYLDGLPALPPPEKASQEPSAAAPATQPADELRKTKVKRAALMQLENVWPTVANDLQHANRNGLAEAAKSTDYALWWEEAALHWARINGRLLSTPTASSLQGLPKRVNRLE